MRWLCITLPLLLASCEPAVPQPAEIDKVRVEKNLLACTTLINPQKINEENIEEIANMAIPTNLAVQLENSAMGKQASVTNKEWALLSEGDITVGFDFDENSYQCRFSTLGDEWIPVNVIRNGANIFSRDEIRDKIETTLRKIKDREKENERIRTAQAEKQRLAEKAQTRERELLAKQQRLKQQAAREQRRIETLQATNLKASQLENLVNASVIVGTKIESINWFSLSAHLPLLSEKFPAALPFDLSLEDGSVSVSGTLSAVTCELEKPEYWPEEADFQPNCSLDVLPSGVNRGEAASSDSEISQFFSSLQRFSISQPGDTVFVANLKPGDFRFRIMP